MNNGQSRVVLAAGVSFFHALLVAGCTADDDSERDSATWVERAGFVNSLSAPEGVMGYFNAGGSLDLVLSSPSADRNGGSGGSAHGSISIEYNYDLEGLPAMVPDATWDRDSPSMAESIGANDYFGAALAVGRFNSDAYDDLAIGVPGDVVGTDSGVGSIHIMYGSSVGLSASANVVFFQSSLSATDEASDYFGEFLAAGDFDNDGYDDLAVGAPREDIGATVDAGAFYVIYGDTGGLTATGAQAWSQATTNVEGDAEASDECAGALAAADFDDDGYDDIAWGCPGEDVGAVSNAGSFSVIYGSASGLDVTGDQLWTQDSASIADASEADDEFGRYMAAGDVDSDGVDDVLVGTLDECDPGLVAVHSLYGAASSGIVSTDNSLTCEDPVVEIIACSEGDCPVCVCALEPDGCYAFEYDCEDTGHTAVSCGWGCVLCLPSCG